jgi:hypothetical protein
MFSRLLSTSLMIAVAAGSARAEPWKRHTIDGSSRGADGVRLDDVNDDGLRDIVTGWEEGGLIRAYLNPGSERARQQWPAVSIGKVASPEDAVFVDLDADGSTDVVSCCEGRTRTVFLHWAPHNRQRYLDAAAWTTAALPVTQGKQSWMFALPMQIDGRHGIDLVVASKGSGASIGWLESPGDPHDAGAWRFHLLYRAGWVMSLQARDMDEDGDLDILASDRKGARRGVLWLENPGAQAAATGAEWKEHRVGGQDREVMFLTTADLDQDGRQEIVCAVKGRGVSLFQPPEDDGGRWEHHEISMPPGCGSGKGVAVCDIDADGRQDIVFTCEHATTGKSGVRWLSYADSVRDTVWRDHEISGPEGVKFDRVELLDLDGDSDPDVLTCEERDNLGVIWYENPTR